MNRSAMIAAAALAVPVSASMSAALAAPAMAQDSQFVGVPLFNEYVPDGGGVEDASGEFDGEFDLAGGRICYYLDLYGLDDATGFAIHEGEPRENGPLVIALQLPTELNEEVCVQVAAEAQRAVLRDLEGHYMVVTSPGHPDGAVRGQMDE